MNCPRCETELKAIEFAELGAAKVHLCPGCEGAWYPSGALDGVANKDLSEVEASELAPALEADKLENVDLDKPVSCPECSKEMDRYSYALAPDTMLDRCSEHGVWLDDGELGVMLEQISQHRTESKEAKEAIQAMRKEMNIDGIAKGSPYNPFAGTLRILNWMVGGK